MTYGLTGLHQVTLEHVNALADRLGLPWQNPTADVDDLDWHHQCILPIAEQINPLLADQHLALVRAHLDPNARPTSGNLTGYVHADTTAGERNLSPFQFEMSGDRYEIGERWPDDYAFGVTVATRYFPTWMDWRSPHGVFHYTHDEAWYRLAADAITAAVPEFADGYLTIRFSFF